MFITLIKKYKMNNVIKTGKIFMKKTSNSPTGKFTNLISNKDIKFIEEEKLKCKERYFKNLSKIKNYDKYVELFGDEKNFEPTGIIKEFAMTHWCKLDPKTPTWSYPIIYNTAMKHIKNNSMRQPEDLCAKGYAMETVCYIEKWFKDNKLDINKFIV